MTRTRRKQVYLSLDNIALLGHIELFARQLKRSSLKLVSPLHNQLTVHTLSILHPTLHPPCLVSNAT
jgi:hypothetical protein